MIFIGYETMHKEMMVMATVVVTQVEVLSEDVVMVVCLEEAKLFATTVIRQAI